MAFVLKDRVQETCNSPGTGTVTLLGAAIGYQTFSAAIGNGNTTYYAIVDQGGSNWEVGYGTYSSAGNALARTTVLSSSNGGSLVNFSSGVQNVWVDYPAPKAVNLDANGKLSFGGNSTSYADWASSSPTVAAGRMWYDGTTGAWNLGMGGGNISQQVGEEFFVYGKASAAITDSPLQIVYQTGVVGSSGVITFAPTVANITNGDKIIGVATESIALNGFGRVISSGVIRGITTNGTAYGETWANGDEIWYNPVTGNPTNVKPVAPNIKVLVGIIINAGSGSSGSIQVEINHGSVLGGTDSNVQLGTSTGGQILTYNQTGQYWINTNLGAGTGFAATTTAGGGLSVGASVAAIGTWMGTPSSANLAAAMTDETGSGLLVFNNTPTFISPLLGTPTSGNLSNCTNLPAGQLTGTIPSGVLGNSSLFIGTTSIALNRASANLALTGLLSGTFQGSTSGSVQLIPAAIAGTGTVLTMPATTGTIITSGDTGTVTNTMLAGSIANNKLTNSSITINGSLVSLGGSVTVTATASNALTISSPLSGTSYNGSAAVSIGLSAGYGDTQNPFASKTANFFLAAPNGTAGAPTFRAIVAADIPTLNQNTTGTASNVTGTVAIANGGTGATTRQNAMDALAGAVTSGQYLRGNGTDVVMSAIQAADVPTLNQNTTGTAANVTGVVAAANGGTGQSSYTIGDLLFASGATALSKLADVATGNALISGGVGVAPSWGKIGLTTHISGTLAVGNGGTGLTSLTAGYIPFGNGTSAFSNAAALNYSSSGQILNIGTAGTALTSINQNNTNEASISFWSNNIATPSQANNFIIGMDTTANGGGGFMWNRNNNYIKFATNNSERGRFSAAGNWLIGTTADPTGGATTQSIVANGAVYANNGTTGGFWTSTFGTGVSNNIWAFGNAINYGLKYFQGTAGTHSMDTIGFPFGQSTSPTSFFQFIGNGSSISALVMTKQPAFRAALTNNGDQTLTNSVLAFNVEIFDKSSSYDPSTATFTAPVSGTYFFYVQTYGTSSAGAATMSNTFQVNGSSVSPANGDTWIGGTAGRVNIAPLQTSMTINLSIGDTVRVFASAYNDAAVYRIYTGNSIFTGWLIG